MADMNDKGFFKDKVDAVSATAHGAAEGVSKKGKAAVHAVSQVGSDAVDAVTKAGANAADAVAKAGTDALNAATKAADEVKETAGDLADSAKNSVSNAAHRVSKAAGVVAAQAKEVVSRDDAITEEQARQEIEARIPEATALLENEYQLEKYLCKMEEKLKKVPAVGDTLSSVPVLISLTRQWVKKEYTVPPIASMAAIVAALLYFLAPADLIPDAVPGLGFLDDAVVLGVCLALVGTDVDAYKEWREKQFGLIAGR